MRTGLSFLALMLFVVLAHAQPSISITNGNVTVAMWGDSVDMALQTATNLSPQTAWKTVKINDFTEQYTVPATNQQRFFRVQYGVPIFQFAVFYNLNLEIDPGSAFAINGPVFSNAGMWLGSATVRYNSSVQAVNTVTTSGTDPFCSGKTDNGTPVGNFLAPGQPMSNAPPLNLPADTNNAPAFVRSLLGIPPSDYALGTPTAYSPNGRRYFANAADLVVSNAFNGTNFGSVALKGTNFTVYFQNSYYSPAVRWVTNDFYLLKTGGSTNWITQTLGFRNSSTNVQYAGYSFLTNVTFYDYREGDKVHAVQVDVAKFRAWLTNGGATYNAMKVSATGNGINSMYIYTSVPNTGTNLPAVRMVNGDQLPTSGFTVVTPFPMYVKGNYNIRISGSDSASSGTTNTTYTYPAALMADAVTVLSSNWSDTNTVATTLSSRTTVKTTLNAAVLQGIVPSTNSNYSGGLESSLRLLENWNGTELWYNGSFVVMFPSQYATSAWLGSGFYYSIPTRRWGFDTNFISTAKLPPLTPFVLTPVTQ